MRMLAATDWSLFSKGVLTIVCAVIFLMGSVFVLLSSFVGRKMAYLIEASAFFSWMLVLSLIWTFGFWSQGPTTESNTGPRGATPAWVAIEGDFTLASTRYPVLKQYPGLPWMAMPGHAASITEVNSAVQTYLANQANQLAGIPSTEAVPPAAGGPEPSPASSTAPVPVTSDQFTVQNVVFASQGHTSLAVAQGYYSGGGPMVTVFLYHDPGSLPTYSWIVLGLSILGLMIHVPLLDRVERKRKAWLTGGGATPAGA